MKGEGAEKEGASSTGAGEGSGRAGAGTIPNVVIRGRQSSLPIASMFFYTEVEDSSIFCKIRKVKRGSRREETV